MKSKRKKQDKGYIWNSILLMFLIFILHILLVIGLVITVIVLQGFLEYTAWIFLSVFILILGSGFWFWRKFQQRKESLSDILNAPSFKGRDVEVSFLGGTVNLKLGAQSNIKRSQETLQEYEKNDEPLELEDQETIRIRDLKELGRLMEKGLITEEEYNLAKRRLLDK